MPGPRARTRPVGRAGVFSRTPPNPVEPSRKEFTEWISGNPRIANLPRESTQSGVAIRTLGNLKFGLRDAATRAVGRLDQEQVKKTQSNDPDRCAYVLPSVRSGLCGGIPEV